MTDPTTDVLILPSGNKWTSPRRGPWTRSDGLVDGTISMKALVAFDKSHPLDPSPADLRIARRLKRLDPAPMGWMMSLESYSALSGMSDDELAGEFPEA